MITMDFQLLPASAATTLVVIISILIIRRVRASPPQNLTTSRSSEPTILAKVLASKLPESVILQHDAAAFENSTKSYWAQQECEVTPACVVRPRDVRELCTAVTILKHEYDERRKRSGNDRQGGLFAIRGGSHSPISGAATVKGGVVIDLSRFCDVIPSDDGSSVAIGAGAK